MRICFSYFHIFFIFSVNCLRIVLKYDFFMLFVFPFASVCNEVTAVKHLSSEMQAERTKTDSHKTMAATK